jgi:glucosamine-phosphate N-acetyltransferase
MIFREIELEDYKIYRILLNQLTVVNDFTKEEFNLYLKETSYKKTFMMIVDKDIIGTGSIIFERKISRNFKYVGHIEDIVIDKKYRGNGYGKELILYLKDFCINKNCYKIILNCEEKNKKFYEKYGFTNKNLEMSYYI